jgi:hypothetical protein
MIHDDNESERIWSEAVWGNIPAFPWRNWGKPKKTSVRMVDAPVKIMLCSIYSYSQN